jgi:hypothetical protein
MFWPLNGGGFSQTGGSNTGSSTPTTVTGGTANTKGAWTQMIASTTYDAYGVVLATREGIDASAQNRACLVDIGIGGSSSEAVLIPDVVVGQNTGSRRIEIPMYVPAGSRISCRVAGATASQAIELSVNVVNSGGWWHPYNLCRAVAYGIDATGSTGTALATPGGTNTKGAWTQLVASTTNPIRYLVCMLTGTNTSTWASSNVLADFGVGGAGSEQVLFADLPMKITSTEYVQYAMLGGLVNIPTGSRLVARFQASDITDQQRAAVIGVG